MPTSFGGRPASIKMASLFNGRSATDTKIVRNRGSSKCLYLSRFSRCVNLIGLDRATQYPAALVIKQKCRGVLDHPPSRVITTYFLRVSHQQAPLTFPS